LTGRRLLVVDDEPDILEILTVLFHEHAVTTAASGADALALLQARPFDVLITDARMPGMSGFALIEAARKLYPRLPVVVVTGHHPALDPARAAGYRWLAKPFRGETLRRMVAAALADAADPSLVS
jgi:DNA-binding NtrC family response regulator